MFFVPPFIKMLSYLDRIGVMGIVSGTGEVHESEEIQLLLSSKSYQGMEKRRF
jgi:hypothetical protein